MVKIAPSILSADFTNLYKDINEIKDEIDYLHCDVMDGHFVPNISFGLPVIKSIKGRFKSLPLDIHLMIENPDFYVKDFAQFASILTVHYEACNHLDRTINYIKSFGIKAFVSINPHTSVELLTNILNVVDGVLIMSVNPGFGGQKFIKYSLDKIRKLDDIRKKRSLNFSIEVDGGVSLDNKDELIKSGVDILVAGSAIFKSDNRIDTIKRMR
jgi:ribulose-phosphate 3-epimerase